MYGMIHIGSSLSGKINGMGVLPACTCLPACTRIAPVIHLRASLLPPEAAHPAPGLRGFRVYAIRRATRSASVANSRAGGKEDAMTDRRPEDAENAEEPGTPVPKDLPDQQAKEGEDPLDVPEPGTPDEHTDKPDQSVPDMDETGAGRRGAPRSGGVHPDQPVPDEAPG
jgi:hypothetical protein